MTGIDIRYSLSVMQTDNPTRSHKHGSQRGRAASCALAAAAALLLLAPTAFSQAPTQQALVQTSYANVHSGSSTNDPPLVLVPQGTVLPIIGRRGEWLQVALSPQLRETGMVVRWYEGRHDIIRRGVLITVGDEDSGWMHDSTVEISEVEAP